MRSLFPAALKSEARFRGADRAGAGATPAALPCAPHRDSAEAQSVHSEPCPAPARSELSALPGSAFPCGALRAPQERRHDPPPPRYRAPGAHRPAWTPRAWRPHSRETRRWLGVPPHRHRRPQPRRLRRHFARSDPPLRHAVVVHGPSPLQPLRFTGRGVLTNNGPASATTASKGSCAKLHLREALPPRLQAADQRQGRALHPDRTPRANGAYAALIRTQSNLLTFQS